MHGHLDRNPHHHIPPDFQERSTMWMISARNLVTDNTPFIYMSVENLMFAERPILQMEKTLARKNGNPPDPHEPFLRANVFSICKIGRSANMRDRKSTRLNSSHLVISYAV